MITGLGKNVGAIHEIWADLLFRNLRILRLCDFFVCWSLIRNYRVSRMWWNAIKWPRHSLEWEPFSFEGGPRHWLPFHLNLAIITSISAPPDFLYFSYLLSVFKSIATTHQENKQICGLFSAQLFHQEQEWKFLFCANLFHLTPERRIKTRVKFFRSQVCHKTLFFLHFLWHSQYPSPEVGTTDPRVEFSLPK